LLGILHFQEEVEYFGKHVISLVRELPIQAGSSIAEQYIGGDRRVEGG
jgi:hypothetical protein